MKNFRWFSRKSVLAAAFTAGFLGILAALLFHEQPQNNRDILNVLLGGYLTIMIRVAGNEFPSHGDSEPPKLGGQK